MVYISWTPHPVIVTTRDNDDCVSAFVYSYSTTIAGVHPRSITVQRLQASEDLEPLNPKPYLP